MRKLTLSLIALAFMTPGTAMACHNGNASSVSVNCEQGVRVYRATPVAALRAPAVIHKRSSHEIAKQWLALQSERLAVQADRIDALENQLDKVNRPSQRRHIYSAPVRAFGGAPFVRRRGFKNRRRSGFRVRYNRGIRG